MKKSLIVSVLIFSFASYFVFVQAQSSSSTPPPPTPTPIPSVTTTPTPTPTPVPTPTPTPSVTTTPTPTPTPVPTPSPTPVPTPTPAPSIPTVTAISATSIGITSARLNGNLVSIGSSPVTQLGFEYGIGTLNKSSIGSSASFPTGAFYRNISSLQCGTTYTYRAYARNSSGVARSVTRTFNTLTCPPAPTMDMNPTASSIGTSSVTLNGEVKNSSVNITERGFEYGLTSLYGSVVKSTGSFSVGSFSLSLKNLTPGTVYNFRSYAKNPGGTSYSSNQTFTTNVVPLKLTGWAWSSNIGWVNLDPITIDQNGNLIGYAWSNNIGWIRFHDLRNYPSGGAPGGPAKINLSTGQISGWVRACAGTTGGQTDEYGGDCSNMVSRTDGWDGWIELAGLHHVSSPTNISTPTPTPSSSPASWLPFKNAFAQAFGFGGLVMRLSDGVVGGMAWGQNVIGWLQFNANVNLAAQSALSAICVPTDINGKIRFTANPSGGSGDYLYDWDNAGTWAGASTFEVAYNSSDPVNATLKVKENGGTNVVTVNCVGTPTRPGITIPAPGCRVNDQSNPITIGLGQAVTFTVTNALPNGAYKYSWITGSGANQLTDTPALENYTYPANGNYNARVSAIDNSGGPNHGNSSPPVNCPRVTVVDPDLKLYVGSSVIGAQNDKATSIKIRQGRIFALAWENTLKAFNAATAPDGYLCEKLINNAPITSSSVPSDWQSKWTGSTDPGSSGNIGNLNAVDTGEHTFTIRCRSANNTLPNKEENVKVHIIDPNDSEI